MGNPKDIYASHQPSLVSPAEAAEMIIPNDSQRLDRVTRCLYVGTGGDLTVEFASGDEATLTNLQSGMVYPFRIRLVKATGTTATGLVGLS